MEIVVSLIIVTAAFAALADPGTREWLAYVFGGFNGWR